MKDIEHLDAFIAQLQEAAAQRGGEAPGDAPKVGRGPRPSHTYRAQRRNRPRGLKPVGNTSPHERYLIRRGVPWQIAAQAVKNVRGDL